MVSDPISDMLTRIRNAALVHHAEAKIPLSKLKASIAKILKQEGYIADYKVEQSEGVQGTLHVKLKYLPGNRSAIVGLKRMSRPGRRLYVGSDEIPGVQNGMGVAILSTSKGMLSGKDAKHQGIGGELICEVW